MKMSFRYLVIICLATSMTPDAREVYASIQERTSRLEGFSTKMQILKNPFGVR